jgi:hypothetical protein
MDQSTVQAFFRMAFGTHEGWACIATLVRGRSGMEEFWFHLPEDHDKMQRAVQGLGTIDLMDVYYCPQLFHSQSRRKDNCKVAPSIWADLDTCGPDQLEEAPSLLVESSPGRFQALWVVDGGLEPTKASEISKRLAYKYAEQGADRSGWDISQLLRVPGTINYKYIDTDRGRVEVEVVNTPRAVYRADEFDDLPRVTLADYEKIPFPEEFRFGNGREAMEAFRLKLTSQDWQAFEHEPSGDWSKVLFSLEMSCFEAGMDKEDVYRVVSDAGCNKFRRRGLDHLHTWADVCRAYGRHLENTKRLQTVAPLEESGLLTSAERERVAGIKTFVEDFIEWASSLGDAAVQYHQGGAFIILSAILSGSVFLPTSFGTVKPNLWFMILADTTLTRKSTAMDIAMDMLAEVDSDAIMATDGSIEGLFQGLSTRPGKPSIFLRDEFSGLLEQITKKDYYAGMAEVLTKLYDGKLQKRLLRKETIEVRDPNLIIFAGGIKNRVQQLLKFDHVSSGFIPRFLFLTAESDLAKVKPLGPPTTLDTSERDRLLQYLIDLKQFYDQVDIIETPQGAKIPQRHKWAASLTPEAWERYNKFEKDAQTIALKSERPDLMTPLYDRLSKSMLKAVLLLAAVRRRDVSGIYIDVDDILLGIKYAEGWINYAIDIVNGIGASASEQQMEGVFNNIKKHPGISRSTLMRNYHLSAREADAIFITLEQRGMITKTPIGKGYAYNAMM